MTDQPDDFGLHELANGMSGTSDSALGDALSDAVDWIGDGVEGVGEGRNDKNEPCIVVFASALTPDVAERIPATHRGFDVVVHDSDPIHAQESPPDD